MKDRVIVICKYVVAGLILLVLFVTVNRAREHEFLITRLIKQQGDLATAIIILQAATQQLQVKEIERVNVFSPLATAPLTNVVNATKGEVGPR